MNFTDVFFEFPIRIYDIYSLANVEKAEDEHEKQSGELISLPASFVVGVKAVHVEDIKSYMEVYPKEAPLQEIIDNGFPHTLVTDNTGESYECVWDRKEFKRRINLFVKELNDKVDKENETLIALDNDKQ